MCRNYKNGLFGAIPSCNTGRKPPTVFTRLVRVAKKMEMLFGDLGSERLAHSSFDHSRRNLSTPDLRFVAQCLYTSRGLLPIALETPDYVGRSIVTHLSDWLETLGCRAAWESDALATDPDVLIGDGQQNSLARGAQGSLWLTEQIVNALDGGSF